MRAAAPQIATLKARKDAQLPTRSAQLRKTRLRSLAMDALETRTLMSTLPAAIVTNQVDVSGTGGNQSSPSIAVDPINPNDVVTVWTRLDPNLAPGPTTIVEGAYSTGGGAAGTWKALPAFTILTDPTSSPTAPTPFALTTDASVAFDRNHNFYVLTSEHKADNSVGVLLLNKFNLSGGSPAQILNNQRVYGWQTDQALKPTLAVDSNVKTFTDNGQTQTDPSAGSVYVAWATIDANPNNFIGWNPNTIRIIGSSDGGNSFSGLTTADQLGNFGNQRDTAPRLSISQGTSDGRVAGGQVSVVWDDFGSLANATPTPLDAIKVAGLSGVATSVFSAIPGPIADAGASNAPTTTTFPINVPAGTTMTVADLTVTLDILHPAMGELSATLVAPDGVTTVPLFLTTKLSGANLGIGVGGSLLNTVFDDNSPRAITNSTTPYIGTFVPQAPFGQSLSQFFGKPIQTGNWQLQITDSTTNNSGQLRKAELIFSSGLNANFNTTVTTTTVRGALGITSPTASAADPLGIAPAPSLASDNTLGAFSPNQGRLYLTYVNRYVNKTNSADNTDIFIITSDNGGQSWSGGAQVNNDNATTDGFSEASTGTAGRAQFEPAVAVDQATGTVVVTYYDGRYDAARSRVATSIATSIDGGNSFSPEAFANAPLLAHDQATGLTVNLGPIPDNESSGNTALGADRATFAFGDRQGLAVLAGHVYPAWSSNQNGGDDGKQLLNIRVATSQIAAGPRIIGGTMGPVGLPGDSLNGNKTTDGSPIAQAFIVTFDRPVDPATFPASAVQVFYHDTTPGNATGASVPVLSVAALNTNQFGATRFQVNFLPSSNAGTYSYAIAPVIEDRIRSIQTVATAVSQTSASAASPQVPLAFQDGTGGPNNPNLVTSTIPISGIPAGQIVTGAVVNLTITYPFTGDLILTLIAPDGTRIILADQVPSQFAGSGAGFINTTFSDSATIPISQPTGPPYTGSFKPEQSFAGLLGKAGNGNWKLEVNDVYPAYDNSDGSLVSWSLTVKSGTASQTTLSGNAMDQAANATPGTTSFAIPTPVNGTPFVAPFTQDTLPLIVPGPYVVGVSVPGGVADVPSNQNTLMLNGTVSAVNVSFDRDMNAATITPASILRMQGPSGLITGPFTVTQVSARVYRIGFPIQQLNGTYTLTLASTIKSAGGLGLDTNHNAGVDAVRGISSTAPVPVTFNSPSGAVTLTPGRTVASQIVLTDDFLIQGLTLQLNITFPHDPDLTAVLVAPDGTQIPLFTGVGSTGNTQNFTSTIFDDNGTTSIVNGGPPFFGRFRPEGGALGVVNGSSSVKGPGGTGVGIYTLEITNASVANTGTLDSWSVTLQKPTVGTGLGEPVADRAQLDFRIFTMDPTNPVSSNTWTSVGPASVAGANSGRIGGIAVDPSDPSGNTVYIAGATGGVWKTNNFLTTDSRGPTYIPITDFGPTFGINIGGIAVYGYNNDPNRSIIVVATGDGDGGAGGAGFLVSKDAGATWALMDSTDNTLPLASRDHAFVGSTAFKVLVDPHATPSGDVIIYAALSGNNGGIWRSTDSGLHWGVVDPTSGKRIANLSGQATDVTFDPGSGPADAVSNPTGNLQVIYAALRGQGVYISPNQGQVWNLMAGGVGDPLIQDPTFNPPKPIAVANLGVNPNGPNGRIVLAKPALVPSSEPNSALKNFIYQGWLYAVVVTPNDHLQGVYLTKDNGQNWTNVRIPTLPPDPNDINANPRGIPTNDTTQTNYDPLGNKTFAQGNYDVSLGIDPTNPNVIYLGGTADGNPSGLIRINVTGLSDPHSFYLGNQAPDGGALTVNSNQGATLNKTPALSPPLGFDPRTNPTINLIRDPSNPLGGNATFYVQNTTTFGNDGSGAKWLPFDLGGTDQHRFVTMIDPLTGHARLIIGDDQGVFSAVDDNGVLTSGIGSASSPSGSRNGNLQITQFYYGAAQPSSAAAQIANALFYGQAQDDGSPHSNANIIGDPTKPGYGIIRWTGPAGDGTGVATDQTGSGTLYQYQWPCCGGNVTDFFQVNGVGRTNGLIQSSLPGNVPDPQWPYVGGFNFGLNPINGNQIAISSGAGRIFRTEDQGKNWFVIGDPAVFGGSNAPAITFGAPDPATGGGSLDNFIYAGTNAGHIYVTFTGGGASGNAWLDITNGDLAGNTSGVKAIVTNPTRGSHEAFAVTGGGVYYTADSNPGSGQTWHNITGNLFNITHNSFGDPTLTETQLKFLTSMVADWRYVIPDTPGSTSGPTHPLLYVGGDGGVYQSSDKGKSWALFPAPLVNSVNDFPNPPGVGGGLPNAQVNDLDLSLGNVDPTTGRAIARPGDPNVLVATTYGRGEFAIRLAPNVLPNTTTSPAHPDRLFLDTSSVGPFNGGYTTTGLQYTTSSTPIIDGTTEQSAFGNVVNLTIFNLTLGTVNPPAIPLSGSVQSDANGRFMLHVAPGYFTTSGVYTIGVQATDASGSKGNIATFTFVVDLNPPAAPTKIVLDPTTDSGTYNTDQYTNFNNNPSPSNAPLLDVSGIQAGASVVLLRASEINGVVGAYSVVNTLTNSTGGVAKVTDLNSGATIPDTPLNPFIDTAPNQPNQYVYQAYQVDTLNVQGNPYTGPLGVIVDTTAPSAPTSVKLDPTTDSGTLNNDSYTKFNNSKPDHSDAPIFDVAGIEPHASVQLIRTDWLGNIVVVNTVFDTAGGLVKIADLNAGNGVIPDNPVGAPPDTAPPAGKPYVYTAKQIDLAGNISNTSPSFGNRGAIVFDGTDANVHGFADSSGNNLEGWFYMQKVLDAIEPNISDGKKVMVALGAGQDGSGRFITGTADQAIESAFAKSSLPGKGWSLDLVIGTSNMDAYLKGQPAVALDKSGNPISGKITIAQTGFLYITTSVWAGNDLTDADLKMLNTHGPDIKAFVNTGGGLYTQAETPVDETAVQGYGWLSSLFPTMTYTTSFQGATAGIALTAQGQAIFPGLVSADLQGGPWHGYFGGAIPPVLATMITAIDDTSTSRILGLASVGGGGVSTSGNQVIIDSVAPLKSVITLDPTTDTGTHNNDGVTKFNNSKPDHSNAPLFDVTNAEPNGIINLFRAPIVGGVVGAPVLVNTITQGGSTITTAAIPDLNAGNGTIPDGAYQYTTQQTDLAGNVGPLSDPATVVIATLPPAAPRPFFLDPAFDTGTFNNDGITYDNNGKYPAPQFDAVGIVNKAKLELFRSTFINGIVGAPVLVNTLNDTAPGTVLIADSNAGGGAIPNGTYQYTAQQFDLAGNIGIVSAPYTVVIDTDGPQADPPAHPALEASSDTGTFNNDQITQDNNGLPYPAPIFDAGTLANPVEQGATVALFRAPVVNNVVGAAVLVNTLINTAGAVVPIADINGGHGVIPNGTYLYTIQLTDLAGLRGSFSTGQTVTIVGTNPALPQPFRLDAASDTGVSNTDGITQITLVHYPIFDAGGILKGATLNLFRAPIVGGVVGAQVLANSLTNTAGGSETIADPNPLPDGQYQYQVQQVDLEGNASPIGGAITVTYDTAQPPTTPVPTLDPASDTGIVGDDTTSNTKPFIDVNVTLSGFEANSSLTLVRDGNIVAQSPYNVTTGAYKIQDPGPVPYGTHFYTVYLTDLAGNVGALSGPVTIVFANDSPGTLILDPASDSGAKGDDVTNVTSPTFDVSGVSANVTLLLLRNGLTVASIPTGAGGTIMITDPGPLSNGKYTYTSQQRDSLGNISPPGPSLLITIDTNVPIAPSSFILDPASDSGAKGDNITNVKNPRFDLSGIVAGATVKLLRGGTVVATTTSPLGGTIMITDPGPLADATYVYTTQQVTVAGNTSPSSAPQTITIDTKIPAALTVVLDPASDTGTKGDNTTTIVNPFLDVANVVAGSTVQLYRNGILIKTVSNAPAGLDKIQDNGPLFNGNFIYTALQTTVAGNVSVLSAAYTLTVNTTPPITPTVPTLVLDPNSDTGLAGDNTTSARNIILDGASDPGVIITITQKLVDANGVVTNKPIATTSANSLGVFSVGIPFSLANNTYTFNAVATNSNNPDPTTNTSTSLPLVVNVVTVDGSYSGNPLSNVDLFRRVDVGVIDWSVQNFAPITNDSFGAGSLDVPLWGDFLGTGKGDPAVYRPSTATWYIQNPNNSYQSQILKQFGWAGVDIPAPANYYGNGVTTIGVYRPPTGEFYVSVPNGQAVPVTVATPPGAAGDLPAPANFDNTGKAELAVLRPASGVWYILGPSGVHQIGFGGNSFDLPVPGAYAPSAGQAAQPAFWRPVNGQYFIQTPTGGTRVLQFALGDIPAPGDYEGTGNVEAAVYRPSTGQWFVAGANDTTPRLLTTFNDGFPANDVPVLAPYHYRALQGKPVFNGGVSASSVSAAAATTPTFDFASQARALTSTTATQAPTAAANTLAAPASATSPTSVRLRPIQLAAEGGRHHHGRHASLFDHALESLADSSAHHRKFIGRGR